MTLKHLDLLSYTRHFATINNLFYLNPLQCIATGVHAFYTAIIILILQLLLLIIIIIIITTSMLGNIYRVEHGTSIFRFGPS